jgi:hypothetical protein
LITNKHHISVISVLDVLNTGDDPVKILAEDDNFYLIKHNIRGNSFRNLACEWICYQIFRYFKVSIPEAELLFFDPMLFQKELLPLTGRYKPHIVFGSKWLQARDDLKDDMYSGKSGSGIKILNPPELARILVMDIWLKNSDRQSGNLNMIVSKQKLYAIDHSATFDQEPFIRLAEDDRKQYFVKPGEIGDLITNSNYFSYYFNRYPKEFEKAGINLCEKIEETDEPLLTMILDTLPESWHITEEERKAIIEYLMFRKSQLRKLFTGHLDFSRQKP